MLQDWYRTRSGNGGQPREAGKPAPLAAQTGRPSDPEPAGETYDVIVVGSGPAGATAACFCAREGLRVLLLERGPYPGAKNCGGAAVIAEQTHKLFPNFWEEMTGERVVTAQAYWLMTEDSCLAADFRSLRLASAPFNRLTVKRPALYGWLTAKAVTAGAKLRLGHTVTDLAADKGRTTGVRIAAPHAGLAKAGVVILADGANSLVAGRAGLAPHVNARNLSLYVKETIRLGRRTIEERLNLSPGHGAVIGLIGWPTAGFNGTAALHTFGEEVNISAGMALENFVRSGIAPADLLGRIRRHPFIGPLLAGGESVEYGASMIPEGGWHSLPDLVHPGLLLAGDAAALVNGTQGINLAMWSGFFAAQAAVHACRAGDFSREALSLYRRLLDESFVMQNLRGNAGIAGLMRERPYLFDLYARVANEAAYRSASVYTMPQRAKRLFVMKKIISMQPIIRMAGDAWQTLRALW